MVWFLVPESLSPRRRQQARKLKHEQDEEAKNKVHSSAFVYWISKAFGFLSPLALFWPVAVDSNPLKRKKRDWNLLLLAVAYGSTIILMVKYLKQVHLSNRSLTSLYH